MPLWILSRAEISSCAVGLDGAGKTTVLFKFKLGEVVATIPTIGEFRKTKLS